MPAKSKKPSPKKRPPKIEDAKQSSRFLAMAKSLGVDEKDSQAFDRALGAVLPNKTGSKGNGTG